MPLRVEVLLCTYNGRTFVLEQLQSILAQTRPVDLITIRDDASGDDTVAVIQTFVATLTPPQRRGITVQVNPTNIGYAANFAAAIAEARGDILLLCDQDDYWEVDKVATLAGLLETGDADLVFSDGSLIDAASAPLGKAGVLQFHGLGGAELATFREHAFEQLMRRNVVNGAALAVRRLAAQAALPLPCDMPHDYWLALWCAAHAGVDATPRRLYRYRQHDSNLIGIGSGRWRHTALGIWHHPRAPRERELRIWQAVTLRLAGLAPQPEAAAAEAKLAWLRSVMLSSGSVRAWRILCGAVRGDYRRFSPDHSLARDLVSLLR